MSKRFSCFFLIFSLSIAIWAQSSIRLGVLKGISCAPCAYLIENKEKLAVQNMAFQVFDSAQSELPKLLRGEINMGFLAPENAAKVFEKTKGAVVAIGVVQNGNFSLITNEESYGSIEDLRGKTVLVPNEGSESIVFNYILKKKQISVSNGFSSFDENSVFLDFSVPTANIANNLILKKASYAILNEPYATIVMKNSLDCRRAEDFQKIYNEIEEWSSFPALLLVTRADFAKENRDLVKKVVEVYKQAIDWTKKNPAKAALFSEKHKLCINSAVAKNAIPLSALIFREAGAAKGDIEKYLSILIEEKFSSAPEKLPDEEFYF